MYGLVSSRGLVVPRGLLIWERLCPHDEVSSMGGVSVMG